MARYNLLDTIAYGRYTIAENIADWTKVQVSWPDGSVVNCIVVGHTEEGYSITTPG